MHGHLNVGGYLYWLTQSIGAGTSQPWSPTPSALCKSAAPDAVKVVPEQSTFPAEHEHIAVFGVAPVRVIGICTSSWEQVPYTVNSPPEAIVDGDSVKVSRVGRVITSSGVTGSVGSLVSSPHLSLLPFCYLFKIDSLFVTLGKELSLFYLTKFEFFFARFFI